MRHRPICVCVTAMLAALLIGLPASAQPTGTEKPPTTPNERKARDLERPGTKTPPPTPTTNAPKPKAPDRDDDIDELEPGKRDAAIYRKLALEEEKYRKRMAKIERLRELARAKGQPQRLVAIDKLAAKVDAAYEKKTAKHRARLGDTKFKQMREKLKKGKSKGKGRSGARGDDDRDDDTPRTGDGDRGNSKGKPGARGTDDDGPRGGPGNRGPGNRGTGNESGDRPASGGPGNRGPGGNKNTGKPDKPGKPGKSDGKKGGGR